MMLVTLKATYRLPGSLTAVPLAGAERLSRAYLSCLRRAGRGPQLRRAASGLCALRESPEQCELGAERARPMGVTSLRCLIRRSACAARAAGAPVTAWPAERAAQQRARLLRRSDLRERTLGPGLPAERHGRRAWDAGALLPGKPSLGVMVDLLVLFSLCSGALKLLFLLRILKYTSCTLKNTIVLF